jgi:hypothetical protein
MTDPIIAADPLALKKGGLDFAQTAQLALKAYQQLRDGIAAHHAYTDGSTDEIARMLDEVYKPGVEAGLNFFTMLSGMLLQNGADVVAAGTVLQTADLNATATAKGGHGHSA